MELLKRGGKVYLQTVLAYVMCFILYLSFTTIFLGLGTETVGYQTYEVTETGDRIVTGEHYFSEGEKIDYPKDEKYVEIRSRQPETVYLIEQLFAQCVALALFIFFLNTTVSKMAAVDRTGYLYQNKPGRPWYGFVIGAVAAIPSFLWYCVLVVSRFLGAELLQLEYIFNYVFFSYLRLITGTFAQTTGIEKLSPPLLSDLSFWQFIGLLLPVAALPLICGICYVFSFKKINIGESLMYGSKKEK